MSDCSTAKDEILEALLSGRRSCRAFKSEAVPHEQIERMLTIAQSAASWCNTQPWHVTVTQGEGTEQLRAALYGHAQARMTAGDMSLDPDIAFPTRYPDATDQRRKHVGRQLYESLAIARGDREGSTRQALENFRFFGAPHVLLIHVPAELGAYGVLDCGVYLGTLLLAAESLGIAMIPQAALASYAPVIRKHFNIPDHMLCLVGASFGYADADHPINSYRTPRADLGEIVTWEC